MSKLPAREVKEAQVLSPLIHAGLTLLQGVLPAMTAIVGGLYVLSVHLDDQKKAEKAQRDQQEQSAQARYFEIRKPFYEKQLALYFEAAHVVGSLVTEDPSSAEWSSAQKRFLSLYWSELSMVEDTAVETAMVNFRTAMFKYDKNHALLEPLQKQAYCLSHSLQQSISLNWAIDFVKAQIQNTLDAYLDDNCGIKVEAK